MKQGKCNCNTKSFLAKVVRRNDILKGEKIMKQKNMQRKTQVISIKVTPEIKNKLQEMAEQTGQNLSAFILYKALHGNYTVNEVVCKSEILEDLEQLKCKIDNKKEALIKIETIAEKVGNSYGYY